MPSEASTRVWVTCGLATAAVVGAVLLFTNRPDAQANGIKGPPPPAPLAEEEVRAYLLIKPGVNRILSQIAAEFQATRKPGQDDDEALGAKARAQVDAMLQTQHMTREDWSRLSGRVERVVNLIRAEVEFPEARPGIVQRLDMKKNLCKNLGASDPRRASFEREIREMEDLLANGPPKPDDRDRDLVLRYWEGLREITPTIGPAPKPGSQQAQPER